MEFETFAAGLDHPEGAALGPDGTVYAGGEAGQIYRIGGNGTPEAYADTGGFLYGVTVDGGGNVYGCDMGRAEVVRVEPAGTVTTYSRGTLERPLRVPNFAAFDDAGNLYVTDSGEWGADDGFVFRVAPGGETTMWSDAVTAFPNGCCLTAPGDALLVVESHTRRILEVPNMADGSAGVPELVADLTGSQPDGIALAADGTMFVGCYRPDRVWRIEPSGAPEILLDDPDGVSLNQPANVAFFGAELDQLAISSLGGWSIVGLDVGMRGLPLRSPSFG